MDQKPETHSLLLITHFKLWLVSILTNAEIHPDGTLDRRFCNLIDFKSPANVTPIQGVKTYDVSIDPDRNLCPDSSPFDGLCRRFASSIPAVVISASYRLTPENRYPSQYDDGIAILKFLDENQSNADLRASGIIKLPFKVKVIGLVALQPFFGGEERTASELSPENSRGLALYQTDFYWNVFKPLSPLPGEEWDRDNEVINVSGPRAADISGLKFPKTLVVVGGRDILQDRQRNYYD
ncbi:probable carboxylesterase 18 [Tanacetum coccineum]